MCLRSFVPDFPDLLDPAASMSGAFTARNEEKNWGRSWACSLGSYVGKGLEKACSSPEKPNERSNRGAAAWITCCWRWCDFDLRSFIETFGLAIVSKFKNTDNPPDHPEEQIYNWEGYGSRLQTHQTHCWNRYWNIKYILYFIIIDTFPEDLSMIFTMHQLGSLGFLKKIQVNPFFESTPCRSIEPTTEVSAESMPPEENGGMWRDSTLGSKF